jgi:hypothetical protein
MRGEGRACPEDFSAKRKNCKKLQQAAKTRVENVELFGNDPWIFGVAGVSARGKER